LYLENRRSEQIVTVTHQQRCPMKPGGEMWNYRLAALQALTRRQALR
jgi:hypothetical protein